MGLSPRMCWGSGIPLKKHLGLAPGAVGPSLSPEPLHAGCPQALHEGATGWGGAPGIGGSLEQAMSPEMVQSAPPNSSPPGSSGCFPERVGGPYKVKQPGSSSGGSHSIAFGPRLCWDKDTDRDRQRGVPGGAYRPPGVFSS